MTSYLAGVLGLFDSTMNAMMGVPIFSFFLGGFLLLAAFGLFLMLKNSAGGRSDRRQI